MHNFTRDKRLRPTKRSSPSHTRKNLRYPGYGPGENPSIPLERATEERLKISKIAKFESDLLKFYSHLYGGRRGAQTCPHHKTSVNFRKFAKLYLRSLKTYYFQIWHSLPISKALVLTETTDFPWLIHQLKALKKNVQGSIVACIQIAAASKLVWVPPKFHFKIYVSMINNQLIGKVWQKSHCRFYFRVMTLKPS